ncbi:cobalamin biosynthesis protein [Paracoccus sp. (in: a-proteobacteria)]|uniref:cobalamin biosynthesis protein n=1 Tax=Paracoccus sp. TaxID=267 RepID=UPI0032202C0E
MRVAGIGFRRGAGIGSVRDALARAGAAELRRLALPVSKLDQPLAGALRAAGFVLQPVEDRLLPHQPVLSDSAAARRSHGTGSVAEACALAALGPGALLAGPRIISGDGMATVAIATKGQAT